MDSSPDRAGTGQYCQMVRVRQARRKGVTRVNQRLNAPQVIRRLEPGRSGPQSNAHPHRTTVWGTLRLVDVASREATVNICGVAVAMLQGHSWTPTPSNDWRMNVGTILPVPLHHLSRMVDGKARRRLTLVGWGGGPVVVRGRESRPHGEGVQCVSSINADRGGRW